MLMYFQHTDPYIPYNISVAAVTSAGPGESTHVTLYTHEGGIITEP